jgi:hypothetical protein
MKKLLLALVLLIMLTGCQQSNNANVESLSIDDITTYEEIIKDGKVEIDGISYNIQSMIKTKFVYDDNENVIESINTNDNIENRLEIIYKNNQIAESRGYSNGELRVTHYYYYEKDLLIKKKDVTKGGLETRTEYSYGDKTETRTYYNSDGSMSYVATLYMDDNDKILKIIHTTPEEEIMASYVNYYENDLLMKVVEERDGVKVKTLNYEYNNLGDKIMEYHIVFMKEEHLLVAIFYDYEYDENLLPKTVTRYRVQSKISKENIRKY